MEDTFHVFLSSEDSTGIFPENSPSDFTVLLPERIRLAEGKWLCGLLSVHIPTRSEKNPLFICSDICSESVTGEYKLPVLARIFGTSTKPNNILFIPVKKRELSSIRIYIKEKRYGIVAFDAGHSYCVLQFRKDEALPSYS